MLVAHGGTNVQLFTAIRHDLEGEGHLVNPKSPPPSWIHHQVIIMQVEGKLKVTSEVHLSWSYLEMVWKKFRISRVQGNLGESLLNAALAISNNKFLPVLHSSIFYFSAAAPFPLFHPAQRIRTDSMLLAPPLSLSLSLANLKLVKPFTKSYSRPDLHGYNLIYTSFNFYFVYYINYS